MDYGQNSQPAGNDNPPFFTAGAGNISPDVNYFESENNLDLTSRATWNQVQNYRGYRDYREIGNRAIKPSEIARSTEMRSFFSEQEPNQNIVQAKGKIIAINTAPSMPPMSNTVLSEPGSIASRRRHLIRADGDHIGKDAVAEVDQAIARLYQTDDAETFYATIRGSKDNPGMLQDYLKNSYNREVA